MDFVPGLIFTLCGILPATLLVLWWCEQRPDKEPRLDGKEQLGRALAVLYGDATAEIDIIAVHGLGANVDWTWTWKSVARHVHWLRDPDMLPSRVPNGRIMSYSYVSRWHRNAPKTRLQFLGESLVTELHEFWTQEGSRNRPTIFVGHSLGGLVIAYALIHAERSAKLRYLARHAVGFVSLDTPFRGTKMQCMADWAAKIMILAGSQTSIIRDLTVDSDSLWDKLREFSQLQITLDLPMYCFFELLSTDYGKKFGIPHVFRGMVVDVKSAALETWPIQGLDTDHLGLNKFSGPNDPSFGRVSEKIQAMYNDWRRILQSRKIKDRSVNNEVFLGKLKIAKGASYDCESKGTLAEGHLVRCLEGTRTQLLRQITEWSHDPAGKRIFWLCGMAGTGKSTISRTIAHKLNQEEQRLGAIFFFKRGERDRGHASRLFPTITYQLARVVPGLAESVLQALEVEPALCEQPLRDQFEKLLLRPLEQILDSSFSNLVIVIDALDECTHAENVRKIIQLFSQSRLRIFVTSRPELPTQLGFRALDSDLHEDVILEDIQTETIHHDLDAYIRHCFEEIRKEDSLLHNHNPLPTEWPGKDILGILVNLAVPLFIYATTMCRYVSGPNPQRRLDIILQQKDMPMTDINHIYTQILDQMFIAFRSEAGVAMTKFRHVVGSIVVLADPLDVLSLSNLLEVSTADIEEILGYLQSVLLKEPVVRLLHLSFSDFLLQGRKNRFRIDKLKTHAYLADQCLRQLNQTGSLFEDRCSVKEPGTRRNEISQVYIETCLPAEVAYACQYWVSHLVASSPGPTLCDDGKVHVFLKLHFLHWLEALSWLGRLTSAIALIGELRSLVESHKGASLLAFLEDARRFLLRNRELVDSAPLQLYYSALCFAPSSSIVRRAFVDRSPELFDFLPEPPASWSPVFQSLGESELHRISYLSFSQNGHRIVSWSMRGPVRFWDTQTGEQVHEFVEYSYWNRMESVVISNVGETIASVHSDSTISLWSASTAKRMTIVKPCSVIGSVALSPKADLVASRLMDGSIRVWDVRTGEELHSLAEHSWSEEAEPPTEKFKLYIDRMVFSPNGEVIGSTSRNHTIELWDLQKQEQIHNLKGHEGIILVFSFTPDGKLLTSVSRDRTARIWEIQSGKLIRRLEFNDKVQAADISCDGKTIVTWREGTIRLWNLQTGEVLRTFENDHDIDLLSLSPDGKMLASAAWSGKINLWDTQVESQPQKLNGPNSRVSAICLHDKLAASGSIDGAVRIFNTRTGEAVHTSKGHNSEVFFVGFSPGGETLASASLDGIIFLWNAETGQVRLELNGLEPKGWPQNPTKTIVFSPDGKLLASAPCDLQLWDVRTGDQMRKMAGIWAVRKVSFSPKGDLVASATGLSVHIWNVLTGQKILVLEKDHWVEHSTPLGSPFLADIALSPDGESIAVSTWGAIVVTNIKTGDRTKFISMSGTARRLKFSSDSSILDTDAGRFATGPDAELLQAKQAFRPVLELTNNRLRYNNKDVLWLPPEYHSPENHHASRGDVVIISHPSGALNIFRHRSLSPSNK